MARYHLSVSFVIALVFAVHAPPAYADGGSPSDLVGQFQGQLLAVMKNAKTLGVRERYDILAPTVDKTFHVPLMIQIAAGSYWNTATADERMALVMAFRRMSVSILATLFDGYSGEVFKIIDEKPGPQKTRLVITNLVKSDNSKVDIAYVSRRFPEGWQLIDVIVDNGISELKVRRSEYNMILKNKGIPGLIKLLNDKADELVGQ